MRQLVYCLINKRGMIVKMCGEKGPLADHMREKKLAGHAIEQFDSFEEYLDYCMQKQRHEMFVERK